MNNFQTILTAIFLAFFVFAVLIFSGLLKIGKSTNSTSSYTGKVVIWGTFNNPDIYKIFDSLKENNSNLNITYIKKDESTYSQDLIEAFANDVGPDLFLITPDKLVRFDNFIYKIPYKSYPEKFFRESFIDGSEIFLHKDGVSALPIVVDPMVVYYNKNIFSNDGIANVPKYWDELESLNKVLTHKENNGYISQATIALGQYDNINNSKDILVNFILQKGSKIVEKNEDGYDVVLSKDLNSNMADSIFGFFIQFSNPSNLSYSWNRSLPNSLDMFINSKLAMYLGYSSELFNIQNLNPNLSFDVAPMLQYKDQSNKVNYSKIYALAINKNSQNLASSFGVANELTSAEMIKSFSATLSLPPALKSLLAEKPVDNRYLYTFFNSALISHSWIDPDNLKTSLIFSELINNIISNKLSINESIVRAQGQLEQIIKK